MKRLMQKIQFYANDKKKETEYDFNFNNPSGYFFFLKKMSP